MTSLLDQNDDQIIVDPNKNYLEDLVGDGKKFKTVEDLAKGKYEADSFIVAKNRQYDALYEEYNKLREQHNAGSTLQELLDQLKQQQDSSRNTPNTNEDSKPAFNPDEFKSLVSDMIQSNELVKKEETNFNLVQSKLIERFGNNYKTIIKEQANTLGLSDAEVDTMAKKNPNLFFKTFDVNSKSGENFQAPPHTQMRSDSFAPKSDKRTYSYYENMRKTNPNLYLDPKISIQMDKDAQALGEAFFDV